MDTLVVAGITPGTGYYAEMSDELTRRSVEVRAVNIPEIKWESIDHAVGMRTNCVWACWAKDVTTVVAAVTKNFTGQVQVFSLSTIYSRLPGALKQLDVTKDGVLPNA